MKKVQIDPATQRRPTSRKQNRSAKIKEQLTQQVEVCQRREKNNVKRREEIDANAGIKNAGIPTAGCKPPVNCLPESRPGAR